MTSSPPRCDNARLPESRRKKSSLPGRGERLRCTTLIRRRIATSASKTPIGPRTSHARPPWSVRPANGGQPGAAYSRAAPRDGASRDFRVRLGGHLRRGRWRRICTRYGSLWPPATRVLVLVLASYVANNNNALDQKQAGEGGSSGARHARVDAPPSSCSTLKAASRRTLHPASVSAGGLPGFFGPYPSAIRDESRCRVVMRLLTKTLQ